MLVSTQGGLHRSSGGGYDHDIHSREVYTALLAVAQSSRCLGVFVSVPCKTWSALRFIQPTSGPPRPPVLRNLTAPDGIRGPDGSLPLQVARANQLADRAISIATAVAAHGGFFIFESPPSRADGQFAIEGREQHASMWEYTPMSEFRVTLALKISAAPVCLSEDHCPAVLAQRTFCRTLSICPSRLWPRL